MHLFNLLEWIATFWRKNEDQAGHLDAFFKLAKSGSRIKSRSDIKGIVQRILRGVETRVIRSLLGELEAHPFFFLNFTGTPPQDEHNTIFSGLEINVMAFSNQSNFMAFFHVQKMTTEFNQF